MSQIKDSEKQPLLSSPSSDELTLSQLQQNVFTAQRAYIAAWSRTTSGKWHRRIMLSVTALLFTIFLFSLTILTQEVLSDSDSDSSWPPERSGNGSGKLVPLEAHIMSKCPDARDCLHDLILPAMQQVSDKVNFTLSYIGSSTPHNDGVLCKHGQSECLGNVLELCAAARYPEPRIYLGFVMCLSREYSEIPRRSLVEDCALEHGIDMEKLNECTVDEDGALAVDALQASFNRSTEAGVTKSCTVRLAGEIRCVRDEGEWKDCPGGSGVAALVREIGELYGED